MSNRPMVLLLDDRVEARESMRQLLELNELTVVVSEGLDRAISELTGNSVIDLIVTDINLTSATTDKSGLTFAKLAKTMFPTLPIAGYSGTINAAEIDPSKFKFFDVYLNKKTSSTAETSLFAKQCYDLAKQHKDVVAFASANGIPVSYNATTTQIQNKLDDIEKRISSFESTYIKKIDWKKHLTRFYVALAVVGSIASLLGLYFTLRPPK